MIWRSRSFWTSSAISIAFSVLGSSGTASMIGGMLRIRSHSPAQRDARIAGDSLCRRSAGGGRCENFLRFMHAGPIETFDQRGQLRRRQSNDAILDLRPAELAILEPLGEQANARSIPENQLHPIRSLGPENVDSARERIRPHVLAHQRRQPFRSFAEVDRLCRHHNPDRARRPDHAPAFSARITAMTIFASAPRPTRTVTPSISSLIAGARKESRSDLSCAASGASIIAGTNKAEAGSET